MEYFDPTPAVQKKTYAFKCHRKTVDGVDTVYPVNAIAFHPGYGVCVCVYVCVCVCVSE
jgi:cell cycle arrest protein BUB3